jgi:hypothetical protein
MVAREIPTSGLKMKRAKHSSPFRLNMDPDEFLARAIRTKPSEVEGLIKRGKKKKPPGTKRKASGGASQSESVVDLRRRRMRKRETGR